MIFVGPQWKPNIGMISDLYSFFSLSLTFGDLKLQKSLLSQIFKFLIWIFLTNSFIIFNMIFPKVYCNMDNWKITINVEYDFTLKIHLQSRKSMIMTIQIVPSQVINFRYSCGFI
jgi:hypothetical protein